MNHPIRQALRRYQGFELTDADLSNVGRWTQHGSPYLVQIKMTNRLDLEVAARLRGRWLLFVVTALGTVITTLPEHRLEALRGILDERDREISEDKRLGRREARKALRRATG